MYPVHVDERLRAMLIALGDGGTVELAQRALNHADGSVPLQQPPIRLGGLAEVSDHLGVSQQTINHWVSGRRKPAGGRLEFPSPGWTLKCGPVWDLDTVEAFAALAYRVDPEDGENL